MIDGLFNTPNLLAAKRLMDLTALRQEAIASNLANVETPNYRRVDVDPAFERQLHDAIGRRDGAALSRVDLRLGIDQQSVVRRGDGNTVDLEGEMVRLQTNSVEHAVETHLITGAMLRLRTAITGRAS